MIEQPTKISRPTTEDIPRPTASQYSANEPCDFAKMRAKNSCNVFGMPDQLFRMSRLEDVVDNLILRLDEESKNQIQDRQGHDEEIRKIKELSDEDAEIWAGPIIKIVTDEIMWRIAMRQPEEYTTSNIFSKFAADNPADFQMLFHLFGQGLDKQKYAQFLDLLVSGLSARNAAIHYKVYELDEQASMLLRLCRRHPTISAMFYDRWTFILNYERLKGLFPDRFVN
jgi:hypothetical protein